jgi:hypothetical protein
LKKKDRGVGGKRSKERRRGDGRKWGRREREREKEN